jgi:hypothetical protein
MTRNQLVTRFQLALFWSTNLRSLSASFGSVHQASLRQANVSPGVPSRWIGWADFNMS